VKVRAAALSAVLAFAAGACMPEAVTTPTPTPTAIPTSTRPRFELATYMYALQTRGKIRIAVLADDPPFAARDASGGYAGFAIDLGRELATAIFGHRSTPDAAIEWVPVDRAGADAALTEGRADVAIARLVASEQGATVIDLTDAYFLTGERILVRSTDDEIKDLGDLDTKTVCSQQGSGVADRVDDANPFARTLELDTYDSCAGALKAGQVDAVGADERILWRLMTANADTKIVGRPLTVERDAIGVKKHTGDRQGFLPFLQQWLAGVIRDGTWGRLYARHIAPLSKETKTAP
jgi:glutamate transport system substrate-binding protein